jgi:hypothetical protein
VLVSILTQVKQACGWRCPVVEFRPTVNSTSNGVNETCPIIIQVIDVTPTKPPTYCASLMLPRNSRAIDNLLAQVGGLKIGRLRKAAQEADKKLICANDQA